jgi:hypothetical protein
MHAEQQLHPKQKWFRSRANASTLDNCAPAVKRKANLSLTAVGMAVKQQFCTAFQFSVASIAEQDGNEEPDSAESPR